MSKETMEENKSKSIICMYRCQPQSPQDGYYELTTGQGEFLENVDQSELAAELRNFREQGYSISRSRRGGVA